MGGIEWEQMEICSRYGADFFPTPLSLKMGVADNLKSKLLPVNGIRHLPVGDTSGWYVWAGDDLSKDPNYFRPLHIEHIDEWRSGLMKFLGLAPGWRFQVAPGHEDVWFDPSVLIE